MKDEMTAGEEEWIVHYWRVPRQGVNEKGLPEGYFKTQKISFLDRNQHSSCSN